VILFIFNLYGVYPLVFPSLSPCAFALSLPEYRSVLRLFCFICVHVLFSLRLRLRLRLRPRAEVWARRLAGEQAHRYRSAPLTYDWQAARSLHHINLACKEFV